jgi:hypothetical protein
MKVDPLDPDMLASMAEHVESWHSAAYAEQWAGEDVIADMLDLPRRISIALVADAGFGVDHVVDLGSGPGVYLQVFLDAFPRARGSSRASATACRSSSTTSRSSTRRTSRRRRS